MITFEFWAGGLVAIAGLRSLGYRLRLHRCAVSSGRGWGRSWYCQGQGSQALWMPGRSLSRYPNFVNQRLLLARLPRTRKLSNYQIIKKEPNYPKEKFWASACQLGASRIEGPPGVAGRARRGRALGGAMSRPGRGRGGLWSGPAPAGRALVWAELGRRSDEPAHVDFTGCNQHEPSLC